MADPLTSERVHTFYGKWLILGYHISHVNMSKATTTTTKTSNQNYMKIRSACKRLYAKYLIFSHFHSILHPKLSTAIVWARN